MKASRPTPLKAENLLQLYAWLPESERLMVDVLRQIVIAALPDYCREKIAYNVPFFYGNKGICIIWPASIPRGGIKEGVLLGFWWGCKLNDAAAYLARGTNKQVYYRTYRSWQEIDEASIRTLLAEAVKIDRSFSKKTRTTPFGKR
ncbi:hypothetical protein C7T94_10845 [Pedobacter yulinensis]|uniref:YdhG-like domain-containing protein n=1 Tax=Pedobacter yulinensis TaxID=2126353 RepID=A0A2T3HL15_9SPHI|nr:DUF1801 domain-containing protein [Pedobacter yulinensis]PST83103.1 hypothetical protein C7T94_10845 [Pedobacter yulinensis]